jgi:hypothetical protein
MGRDSDNTGPWLRNCFRQLRPSGNPISFELAFATALSSLSWAIFRGSENPDNSKSAHVARSSLAQVVEFFSREPIRRRNADHIPKMGIPQK